MRFLFFSLFFLTTHIGLAQTTAQKRAARLGLGMNLSYLEGYWSGTKARHFGDFTTMTQVMRRKQRIADIAQAGFKTVRIPVCFGAWATTEPPYRWDVPNMLAAPDSLVRWALANDLNVVLDLHHVEFNKSIPGADTTARVVWLWEQIAQRYRHTDPERVLFELRNEPNGIPAQTWRTQAEVLIKTVRAIAPNHTLVVGFHNWNSRDAMIQSESFSDPNVLYTFHFYDPFIFTHQGATWAGPGIDELRDIRFPANAAQPLTPPASQAGTWVGRNIANYATEATAGVLFKRLEAAKKWATDKNVPIFLGEFGSYNRADPDSRCRHAEALYRALGTLQIPGAWWEWDGGFSMFDPATRQLMPCMKQAYQR
jgi:endoglucanase